MAKFGCPAKFIAMVRQLHDGMLARVQNDGEFSDPFPVTNGVFFFFFFFFFILGFTALSRIIHLYRADRSSKVGENRRTRRKTT